MSLSVYTPSFPCCFPTIGFDTFLHVITLSPRWFSGVPCGGRGLYVCQLFPFLQDAGGLWRHGELTKHARSMMSNHSLLDTAGVISTGVYNFTVMEMAFTLLSDGMGGKDAGKTNKREEKKNKNELGDVWPFNADARTIDRKMEEEDKETEWVKGRNTDKGPAIDWKCL